MRQKAADLISTTPAAMSASANKKNLKKALRKASQWEIVDSLKDGQTFDTKPGKMDGYLSKKRNPPLRGWHKRYFVLEDGILTYSKTPSDHQKSRYHGKISIDLSVVSYNRRKRKIDIDSGEFVYHIHARNISWFNEWLESFTNHRLYYHSKVTHGVKDRNSNSSQSTIAGDQNPQIQRYSSMSPLLKGSSQSRVLAWLIDNDDNSQINKDIQEAKVAMKNLEICLEKAEMTTPASTPQDSPNSSFITVAGTEQSKRQSFSKILSFKGKTKDRKLIDSICAKMISKSSASNPTLTKLNNVEAERPHRPSSLHNLIPIDAESDISFSAFITNGKQVVDSLKKIVEDLSIEKEKLRRSVQENYPHEQHHLSYEKYIQQLKQALSESEQQNSILKQKLAEIKSMSFAEFPEVAVPKFEETVLPSASQYYAPVKVTVDRSHSLSSKASEALSFHDAVADDADEISSMTSDSSSDDEDEFFDEETEAGTSEELNNVDDRMNDALQETWTTGRRNKLPHPAAQPANFYTFLKQNFGKDLSKVTFPVTFCEPLNALQRLCEELEYSELLNTAADVSDPYDRIAHVAAFAVSSYACLQSRASTKPFNPMLGETYECIREDKGWSFVSEKVCHHPMVFACHADSDKFTLQQDVRAKQKFWGQTLEIIPQGSISVHLKQTNETYSWNKVTTSLHNVMAGTRWLDQHGDMFVNCGPISCKVTFTKASLWGGGRHDIKGTVIGADGKIHRYLFGKWTEAIYTKAEKTSETSRCIWRAGNLPDDCEIYYGFTRFAIELNELRDQERPYLPKTDSRFRPDQRLLEEGLIDDAQSEKTRIENLQRATAAERKQNNTSHTPRWFKKVEKNGVETYQFTDEYWTCRREPGFNNTKLPTLW